MDNRFEVTAGARTIRSAAGRVVSFPHRWTPQGVTVDADFTGGICSSWPPLAACSMTFTGKPRRWAWN